MGSPRLAVSLDREGGFRRRGTKLAIAGKHGRHVFAIECTRTAGLATSVSATRLHGPRWISTAIGQLFEFNLQRRHGLWEYALFVGRP